MVHTDFCFFFFFQAEDGIRDYKVTGVQTCALPISTAKLQELQKAQGGPAGKSAQILSPEQQAELERFRKTAAETRLALKDVRKNLRQDAESLVFGPKVANIALMPLLVAAAGLLIAALRRRKAWTPASRP